MIPWRLKHRHIWFDINFKISNNLKSGEKNSLMWRRLWNTMLQWRKDTKEIIRTVHLNTLASSHHRGRKREDPGNDRRSRILTKFGSTKDIFWRDYKFLWWDFSSVKRFSHEDGETWLGRLEILTKVRIELEFWKQNLNVENKNWIIWYFMHNSSILHQNFDLKILVKKCHKKA